MADKSEKNRASPKIVPWISWREWERVYLWLMSDDLEQQKLALKRVAAWRCRRPISASVDSTASWIELQILDRSSSHPYQLPSSLSTRLDFSQDSQKILMYSMALIRMIHGITAPFQTSQYALSLGMICKNLNIPLELVEMRHQASHGILPSLEQLRWACNISLNWLRTHYWEVQRIQFQNTQNTIIADLVDYIRVQKEIFKLSNNLSSVITVEIKSLMQRCDLLLSKLLRLSSNQVHSIVIPVLVQYPFLAPRKKSQRQDENPKLSIRYQRLWTKMVYQFHLQWPFFIPRLLLTLTQSVILCIKKLNKIAMLPKTNGNNQSEIEEISLGQDQEIIHWTQIKINDDHDEKSILYRMVLHRRWIQHLITMVYVKKFQAESNYSVGRKKDNDSDFFQVLPDISNASTPFIDAHSMEINLNLSIVTTETSSMDMRQDEDVEGRSQSQWPYLKIINMCLENIHFQTLKIVKTIMESISSKTKQQGLIAKLSQLFHLHCQSLELQSLQDMESINSRGEVKYYLRKLNTYWDSLSSLVEDRVRGGEVREDDERSNIVSIQPASNFLDLEDFEKLLELNKKTSEVSLKSKPIMETIACKSPTIDAEMVQEDTKNHWKLSSFTLPPGIGITLDGQEPLYLDLPLLLDDYHGAIFLMPNQVPPNSNSIQDRQEKLRNQHISNSIQHCDDKEQQNSLGADRGMQARLKCKFDSEEGSGGDDNEEEDHEIQGRDGSLDIFPRSKRRNLSGLNDF